MPPEDLPHHRGPIPAGLPSSDNASSGTVGAANGAYGSTSEAAREARHDWPVHRFLHPKERDDWQRLWQEGCNSGLGQLADI